MTIQRALYEELVAYRNEFAHEMDIPPFLVASNKLLGDLTLRRPSCPERLREIDGVSEQWVSKFGAKFSEKLKEFHEKSPLLNLDDFPEETDGAKEKTVKVICVIHSVDGILIVHVYWGLGASVSEPHTRELVLKSLYMCRT